MGGYGYPYQSYSTYKTEEPSGPAIRSPWVPKSNGNPEGYVTRKTVVPVAARPYDNDYSTNGYPTKAYPTRKTVVPVATRPHDDDYSTNGSPTKAYPTRDDLPQKVDDFLTTVLDEANRPPAVGGPVRNDNYYGNGYGDYDYYNDKERRKPVGSSIRNDNYDRYQPADNYSSLEPNRNSARGWSRPASGWTAPPGNGTHLSEPTNDIGKALGLLKEAAKVSSNGYGDYSNKGRPKDEGYHGVDRPNPSIWAEPPSDGGSHIREPGKVDKAMELAKEAERLKSLKNKILGEPTTPHKDDYHRVPVDTRDATGPYGNFNFKSRPRTPPPTVFNNRNY